MIKEALSTWRIMDHPILKEFHFERRAVGWGVGGGEEGDVRSFFLLKLQVGRRPSRSLQLCNLDMLLMQIECKFQILECRSSRSVCIKKTKGEKFVV
jgi:hypothetical protein